MSVPPDAGQSCTGNFFTMEGWEPMTKINPTEVERYCAEELRLSAPGDAPFNHGTAQDWVTMLACSAEVYFKPFAGQLDEEEKRIIWQIARSVVRPRTLWLVTLQTLCGCRRSLGMPRIPSSYFVPIYPSVAPSFDVSAPLTAGRDYYERKFVLRRQDHEQRTAEYEEVNL